MSFNRLTDELVAQMGSHLNHEDVMNLAHSQKRIYNILKRYKLMKPKIVFLKVSFARNHSIRALCTVKETNGPVHRIQPRNRDAENIDIALECIAKFRSIELLVIWESWINENEDDLFLLNNMFVEKLAETKVKIRNFFQYHGKVDLSSDQFVTFCKKFQKVSLHHIQISPTLICDQNIINKTSEHDWALGKVNNQLDEAMNWKNYVDQHPELTYGVDVVEFPNGTMNVEVEYKATGDIFLECGL